MPAGPKLVEAAQSEMPILPSSWATMPAGEPRSKSHGRSSTSAPSLITWVAALPASSGFDFMSASTVSIWRPSIPPSALISSIAISAIVCAGPSYDSSTPVLPTTKPIVIGSDESLPPESSDSSLSASGQEDQARPLPSPPPQVSLAFC